MPWEAGRSAKFYANRLTSLESYLVYPACNHELSLGSHLVLSHRLCFRRNQSVGTTNSSIFGSAIRTLIIPDIFDLPPVSSHRFGNQRRFFSHRHTTHEQTEYFSRFCNFAERSKISTYSDENSISPSNSHLSLPIPVKLIGNL
jgi:hypothetical protein